jgi:glycosyltransferase involved in cell wall biosynthesis
MNRVSVIIPTYNREKYLQGAIDSFYSQDYENKELMVVDDYSTDGTPAIIEENLKRGQMQSYRQYENVGQAACQNMGIQLATGDLICTLDDDDLFYDDQSLSNRVKVFENYSDLEFLWSSGQDMSEAGEPWPVGLAYKKTWKEEWEKDDIYINSIMFRKDIRNKIGGYYFDDSLSSNEDWDFKIRCLIHCKAMYITQITVWHRVYWAMRSAVHRESGELQRNEGAMRQKLRKVYGGLF